MHAILEKLHGKKTTIVACAFTLIAYLGTKGLLGEHEIWLLSSLLTIIAGGADIATQRYLGTVRK